MCPLVVVTGKLEPSGSSYDGTLYYNKVEDIKPNSSELACTGSLDGCLAVRFRNGDVLVGVYLELPARVHSD